MIDHVEILLPEEIGDALHGLDKVVSALPSVPVASRRIQLLIIGKLSYQLFLSSADPSRWRPLLRLSFASLTSALRNFSFEEQISSFDFAEALFLKGLVAYEVARWTNDIPTGEDASRLLTLAAAHPAFELFTRIGVLNIPSSQVEVDLLLDQLEEDQDTVDTELLLDLTSTSDRNAADAYLAWRGLPLQALLRPFRPIWTSKAAAACGVLGSVLLEGLPPGLKIELHWPKARVRALVELVIQIDDYAKLQLDSTRTTVVKLHANVPPPKGVRWDDWVATGVTEEKLVPNEWVRVPVTQRYSRLSEGDIDVLRQWILVNGKANPRLPPVLIM